MNRREIEALLVFLPVFEDRDFCAYEGTVSGVYLWHSTVEQFHLALYEHHWVFNFNWSEWQDEATCILEDEDKLGSADMETLRKLLTMIARKEHFCDNVFPIACEDGTMKRILGRLKELYESVTSETD